MIITKDILDELTAKAKASERLRTNLDLRNSPEDQSQRMLNAMEPGTVMPIHRHQETTETAVILRGRLRWMYYDEQGNLTDDFLLEADDGIRGISVPKGQWHSIECLESGTIIFESKDGPWKPLTDGDMLIK